MKEQGGGPAVRQVTLLYLFTEDWAFVSHRLSAAVAAIAAGYRVVVATRVRDHGELIRAAGCELRILQWRRSGNTLLSHLQALREIFALYRDIRPDLAHHIALKSVVFGSLAARSTHVPAVVNAVAGLGFGFSSQRLRARVLQPLLELMLRTALRHPRQRILVQNRADRELLIRRGIAREAEIVLIRGSGVDPGTYRPGDRAAGAPIVMFAGRMLWEKGVADFVDVATRLRERRVLARYVVVGAPDRDNPGAVPVAQLEAWHSSGVIEWWGYRDDMPGVLQQASIFCYPTRYGEGVPRVLLEAGACGLALVGSDSPGCREVITDGANGRLVPVGDIEGLASAIQELVADRDRREAFGAAVRETILDQFTLERVLAETLAVYRQLCPPTR